MSPISKPTAQELIVFFPVFKKTFIPENDWIRAISVGENSDYALNDKSGDSIAHLNKFYNELTAIYWVWKNYPLPEYVGFSNYRKWMNHSSRSIGFGTEIYTEPNAPVMQWLSSTEQREAILKKMAVADAILAQPQTYPMSISEQFRQSHGSEIWATFIDAHSLLSPDYQKTIAWYDLCTAPQFFQSFVMRREDFCRYCTDLFNVIDRTFKRHGQLEEKGGERFQPYRYPAYLAERFLMLYAWTYLPRSINSQIILLERA